jgi:hypothetical protein
VQDDNQDDLADKIQPSSNDQSEPGSNEEIDIMEDVEDQEAFQKNISGEDPEDEDGNENPQEPDKEQSQDSQ